MNKLSINNLFIQNLIETNAFLLESNPKKFFKLKSGRKCPFFFDFSKLNNGESLHLLKNIIYNNLIDVTFSVIQYNYFYGIAYKGINLAALASLSMWEYQNKDIPYIYNRKEIKNHGEGENKKNKNIVGHINLKNPIEKNKIILVDDVLSSLTSKIEALDVLFNNANKAAVILSEMLVVIDRHEVTANNENPRKILYDKYKISGHFCVHMLEIYKYIHTFLTSSEKKAILDYYKEYGLTELE